MHRLRLVFLARMAGVYAIHVYIHEVLRVSRARQPEPPVSDMSSLVQSLFGVDDELPEVDQLLSQIPLLEDFEEVPEEASTPVLTSRFGPLVTASQI